MNYLPFAVQSHEYTFFKQPSHQPGAEPKQFDFKTQNLQRKIVIHKHTKEKNTNEHKTQPATFNRTGKSTHTYRHARAEYYQNKCAHTHTHSVSLSLSFSLSHTHTHNVHAHTHTHTLFLSFSHMHTHTHTHTRSLSLPLTHTHTHTYTHTHTHTHKYIDNRKKKEKG